MRPSAGLLGTIDRLARARGIAKIILGMGGQSNSEGHADYHTLSNTSLIAPYPNVMLKQQIAVTDDAGPTLTSYTTAPLAPRTDNATINCGCELTLGRYLDALYPGKFAIAKWAVGSSNLAVDWAPGGAYWTQWMAFLAASEVELGGKIGLIDWDQGEADGQNSTYAANYQANLTAFIAAFRAVRPGVPWMIRRLSAQQTAIVNLATIRAAQAAVVAATANTALVDSDGCAMQVDNTHATADSYQIIGRRKGIAGCGLLRIAIPPVAAFSVAVSGLTAAFADLSSDDDGTIVAWHWTFGDGATSTAQNPTHTYATGAPYDVTLTSYDSSGLSNSITQTVIAVNATWEIDSGSGKPVPATAAHWADLFANFGIPLGAPAGLLSFQESSGSLIDLINGLAFAPAGGPLYAQTIPGWSRVGVKFADGTAAQRFRSSAASLPDISTTPTLVIVYAAINSAPGAARGLFGLGTATSDAEARIATGSVARATSGGSSATGTSATGTGVRPWLLLHDPTTGSQLTELVTDQDRITPVFASTAAGQRLDFGATNGASAPPATLTLAAWWTGADAHAARPQSVRKSILQSLSWSPSWT